MFGETVTGLLELPKLKAWIEGKPDDGGFGFKGNASKCLVAEYLKESLVTLGYWTHRLAIVVSHYAALVSYVGPDGNQAADVKLSPEFVELITTIDKGATAWISKARALDIIGALEVRQAEAARLDRVMAEPGPYVEKAAAELDVDAIIDTTAAVLVGAMGGSKWEAEARIRGVLDSE